jgi:hypothetical protein
MFKWTCLAIAVVFLLVIGWMVNDLRLQVRQSLQTVDSAGRTINDNLPALVERTRKTTDTVSERLPEIVEKIQKTTEVVAELSEDLNQLKELAGVTNTMRDKNLVAYADSVLKAIESSNGTIGLKKTVGRGLKNTLPARVWAVGARKEALFLTLLVRSKSEMVTRLCKTKLGFNWYMQIGDAEPLPLLDWLKEHHPETRDVLEAKVE